MMYPKPPKRGRRERPGPRLHGRPVSMSELRTYILDRDRACLAWQFDPTHVCLGRYGQRHDPTTRWLLSMEHVAEYAGKGLGMRREIAAPDDERHLVAMCHGANVGAPSEELRQFCRRWVATHEG